MSEFDSINLRQEVFDLTKSKAFEPISAVEIVIDEDNVIAADGNSTNGRTLTIENPWGTKAQANNILSAVRGFAYQPYRASGALLNPAAELGDAVNIDNTYSGVYKMSRSYSPLMSADIEAPFDNEIDHEYPFESKSNRAIARKLSAIESELRVTSGEIEAKVSKTSPEGQTSFSWNLTDTAWEIKSGTKTIFKVDSSGATVEGKITATSGKIGGFDIGTSAISYNGLTWNGTKNGIYIGSSGIQLGSTSGAYFQASNSGVVKAHNMTLTGTLNIGGKTITAAALQSGAQSAYSNGGTWSTGAGYGYNYNNATKSGTTTYPAYFRCGTLSVNSAGINQLSIPYGSNVFLFAGQWVTWKSATVGGTTINYLGR